MTDSNSNPEDKATINVRYNIADDKRSAVLRIGEESSEILLEALDARSVESLIAALGELRSNILDPIPDTLSFETPQILSAYNPRWYIYPDSTNSYATFWIRHPQLGWSGFGFPRHEAGNIAKWLRKVIPFSSTAETLSPAASSFGGDKFLFTTEGLGFYYYGSDERRIGPNPFEQVEFDSDRAAGIVAGSIVDTRLEHAIQSKLRDDRDIMGRLFNANGALGAFGTKIDLAYLMGILSSDAYADLKILQKIRNDFAHNLELASFDEQSIRDRCKNFKLVDRHIGPVPEINPADIGGDPLARPNPYMGLPDHAEKLSDPRFRYVMTAQIISSLLGEGADNPNKAIPFI